MYVCIFSYFRYVSNYHKINHGKTHDRCCVESCVLSLVQSVFCRCWLFLWSLPLKALSLHLCCILCAHCEPTDLSELLLVAMYVHLLDVYSCIYLCTHTPIHIYICIYIYMCVFFCMCMSSCVRVHCVWVAAILHHFSHLCSRLKYWVIHKFYYLQHFGN